MTKAQGRPYRSAAYFAFISNQAIVSYLCLRNINTYNHIVEILVATANHIFETKRVVAYHFHMVGTVIHTHSTKQQVAARYITVIRDQEHTQEVTARYCAGERSHLPVLTRKLHV